MKRAELQALQLIWEAFAATGRWPTFGTIDRAIYQATDESMPTLLEAQRPQLAVYDPYGSKDSTVALTIRGIMCCENTQDDLRAVLNAVRWCVTAERDATSDVLQVTPQRLAEGIRSVDPTQQISAEALDRAFGILVNEGIPSTSLHPLTPTTPRWTFDIDSRVRRFRRVQTVADLAEATARPAGPSLFLGDAPIVGRVAPGPAVTGSDPVPETRVFVLMPFRPDWSATVYAAIKEGCIDAVGAALIIERADEITETGSITQQIQERIRQADVLVADLTDTNGNVMYELGYADALGKTVIPINQNVSASPFDVSVHRQIPYVLFGLSELSQDIRKFVATALAARA